MHGAASGNAHRHSGQARVEPAGPGGFGRHRCGILDPGRLELLRLHHAAIKQCCLPSFTISNTLQVVDDKNDGTMKWVPTTVNLNDHIIIPTIPQNLDSPDKFLEDYISNLSKTSLDYLKPMWDLHLLNLKTSTAEAIGIFRIHHSLGDGTSLMSLLLACTRQISNPNSVPTIPTSKNSGWFSFYNFFGNREGWWWQQWLMAVWMGLWLVWNTLVDVTCFMATALFFDDTETPLKVSARAEVTPRRFAHRTVSLDDMKIIKNAMDMTINDVALGVTQAGLSRYLDRRYGELFRASPIAIL
ncbi:hypothetical protein OSB04_031890 [Centaurea solstitialis]|uniref:diacylglycerol O-acyltransferase n=1 Tax=Centaurea solstitialis TaxID=347529 RepID=A0AA38STX7_9ASTR|nr:hypothetical protein OSB04_031890 [Centaurea solstitialis]